MASKEDMHHVLGKSEGWENLNNTEGLPQVEVAGRFGYHRAFIQKEGREKEWFFVKKDKNGEWKRVTKTGYTSVGEVKEVNDLIRMRLAARVFRKNSKGRIIAKAIYLPYIQEKKA